MQPKRPFTTSTNFFTCSFNTYRIVPWVDAVCSRCALAGLQVSIDIGLASGWLHVALAATAGTGSPTRAEKPVHSTTPGVIALASWAIKLWLTLCMCVCYSTYVHVYMIMRQYCKDGSVYMYVCVFV